VLFRSKSSNSEAILAETMIKTLESKLQIGNFNGMTE